MHCVLLADLAATLSQHAPSILAAGPDIPSDAVTDYWVRSRSRINSWHRIISEGRRAQRECDWQGLRHWWRGNTAVLEEVLVSELTTRVVAALGCEIEARRGDASAAPVTHAVFLSHMETRNRVQQLLIDGRGCSVPNAARLNLLRKATERWADAMIGRMQISGQTNQKYAIEPGRAEAYLKETRDYGIGVYRDTANWLMNAALHDMLTRRTSPIAASPRANQCVADSILGMFRPLQFDSFGVCKSLRLLRIEGGAARSDQAPYDDDVNAHSRPEFPADAPVKSEVLEERWFL